MVSNDESQTRHDAKPDNTASGSDDDDGDEETGREYDGKMERGEVEAPCVKDSGNWPYHKFLKFLQSGCNGSPLEGYPIVVLVLSTIPHAVSILPPYEPISEHTAVGAAIRFRAYTVRAFRAYLGWTSESSGFCCPPA